MSPPVRRDGKPVKKLNRRELSCVPFRPFLAPSLFGSSFGPLLAPPFRFSAYPSVKRLQPPAHDWNDALVVAHLSYSN